ncbi:MAG: hypothetical protein QXG39_00200 [Candidatus Aenigmatarchaeota archaeon]
MVSFLKGAITFAQMLVLVILLAILIPIGLIIVPKMVPKEVVPPSEEVPTPPTCPSDLKTSIQARATNPLATGLTYVAATLYYGKGTQVLGSASLLNTGAYTELTASGVCGASDYWVATVNDADFVAKKQNLPQLTGAVQYVDLAIPASCPVEFRVYDSAWVNLTAGWVNDATTAQVSMGSGETADFRVQYRTSSSACQFGSDELKTYICVDFNLAKFSKDNGVVISGDGVLGEASELPTYCANNGYEKAYILAPVKSTEGIKELRVSIKADMGDPGSSDDVKLLFIDEHYYQGKDGAIKSGTCDDAGTAVGESDTYITINLA